MKTAIFGGSFNPVHKEHVNIVCSAKRELGLDRVIVVPSAVTPNKYGRITASGEHRLKMCLLAFDGVAEVSDYEIAKGGISYSYQTCEEFAKRFAGDKLYFIVGADMFENFPAWKYPQRILDKATLAVCAREKPFKAQAPFEFEQFSYVGAKVSSTKIRTLFALGESAGDSVAPAVADYVERNGVYRLEYIGKLKSMLTPERWAHTVRVAVMAAENCLRFGIAENKAITASVLHDCAKYLARGSDELKGFIFPDCVPGSVMHQYTGAYVAERLFGINDCDVLNAIKYHTSGRPDMSPLEKLIYLCDLLEEGRSFEGIEKLRRAFEKGLDEAMYEALDHQLKYLKNTGEPVYPLTVRAYEFIKEKNK